MEIQRSSSTGSGAYGVATSLEKSTDNRSQSRGVKEEAVNAQGDTVTVSQDALLLTEARRTAQNTPDVRADKVASLRIQVANGTYKPDSRLIAENLVREEPWLFQP
ncbi:MAG: flagellar biosynthesis anti-sigma factor FlgM [Desulfovibrio sp.]|nr:flagellar biosynthesis anti-sigma factor FlgM [Desulfovibrio sp.]